MDMFVLQKPEATVALRIISGDFRERSVAGHARYYYRCVPRSMNEVRIFSVGQWLHDRIQEQKDFVSRDFSIIKNCEGGVPKYKLFWGESSIAGSAEDMDRWEAETADLKARCDLA